VAVAFPLPRGPLLDDLAIDLGQIGTGEQSAFDKRYCEAKKAAADPRDHG
jgi:hypothetical protein